MKILYTATVLSHICQFHQHFMKAFQEEGHEVHVAARNNLAEKNGLELKYTDKLFEIPFQRSPLNKQNIKAFRELKNVLSNEHYDAIICNTPVAGVLTRLAANKYRKKGTKLIYIAHGFHFYKGAPLKYWLVFYPIEKFMARHFTDTLVTITEEDYALAKDKFRTNVEHIYGVGVDSERFHPATAAEKLEMRETNGLNADDYVILCTGELVPNKNQKTLINAAARLKDRIPNLKVLLAGNGPEEANIRNQIEELNLQNTVTLLGYRTDLEKLLPAADIAVSCSYREGMPLNVIEAMLCKVPVVVSDNRGHRELTEDGKLGRLVEADDAEGYAKEVLREYNITKSTEKSALPSGDDLSSSVERYSYDSNINKLFKIIKGRTY